MATKRNRFDTRVTEREKMEQTKTDSRWTTDEDDSYDSFIDEVNKDIEAKRGSVASSAELDLLLKQEPKPKKKSQYDSAVYYISTIHRDRIDLLRKSAGGKVARGKVLDAILTQFFAEHPEYDMIKDKTVYAEAE